MKLITKRVLCLLLCLCMLGSYALPVYAQEQTDASGEGKAAEVAAQEEPSSEPTEEPTEESTEPTGETTDPAGEPGQFALAVLTQDQTVIEPTYIAYAAGQTIAQALLSSDYGFEGLIDDEESFGWIQSVEGVSASYSLFFDDNGYDLTQRADTITALCMTTKVENYSENYLELIKTMASYHDGSEGLKAYDKAAQAYETALLELYAATAERAGELQKSLADAIAAYEKYTSGVTFTLTVTDAKATRITLHSEFGKTLEITFDGENRQVTGLAPSSYEFDLTDGGINHVRGTIQIDEDMTLDAQLPTEVWLSEMDIGISNGAAWYAVKKLDDWTFLVPDYASSNLYPYFTPAESVDTKACHMYLVGFDMARTWMSKQTVLTGVIQGNSMEGAVLELEARQESGLYTQYQTYQAKIVRAPSLAGLTVYSDGTKLPLTFESDIMEYSLTTTGDSVDLYPEALCEGTAVQVNGTPVEGESAHVTLGQGTTTITLTVSHENGQSSSYVLKVEKLQSVDVKISTAAESVEVFNAAGANIQPVGGVYALVPGESYTYITTSKEYFHTTGSFTASQGLTVKAPAPNTKDGLSKLRVAAANNADSFDVDHAFDPARHAYTYQVGSNETGFGIEAAMNSSYTSNGYTLTAYYENWNTGAERSRTINSYFTTCSMFVGVSGVGNTMNLRIHKEVDGVTYYQDYVLTAQRKLQLNDLQLFASDEPVVLNRGDETQFLKFTLDYTAEVGQTVNELEVKLKLFSANNDTAVQVTVANGTWSQVLDYTGTAVNEYQTILVPMDPEQDRETVEIRLEREGATSQTYTVELKKLPSISTEFVVEPADALVYLTDDVTDLRVLPDDSGAYILNTSRSYTYVITCHGYLTLTDSFVAGEDNQKLIITMEKAPESHLKDIELDTDFVSFRGNENNNGITDARTPILAEEAVLNWANKIGEGTSGGGVGSPVIVGGQIYTYAGTELFRIDKDTGEILASAPMDHASSFSITPPAYGEGMIFVGLANGGIQAFNAETLESLWLYTDKLGGQPNCPVVYRDGYLYTGFWNAETRDANFVCISVTDEDPTQAKEEKLASWSYTHNGFYWAGAYVTEKYLLVTTDDGSTGYTTGHGSILSLDPATGILLDSLTMPGVGDLRTSVCYDEVTEAYYFASKGGDFYRVQVEESGMFRENSLKQLHLTNGADSAATPPMCTSTPVVYKGRAYIGVSGTDQFGAYSGHNITVIDLTNWKIAYTVRTQGYPQTSGLLTTAYEGETEYVYVYFLDNYTPGKLRVIRDTAGRNTLDLAYSTTEEYTKNGKTQSIQTGYVLFTPSSAQAQYAICSPIVDEYGTLYFKNDSGYLMSLGSVITELKVEQEPERMVYEVGQVFNAEGLKVTAVYANGLSRDVTDYLKYSEDPLTVDDTEFTLTVDFGKHQMMYQNRNGLVGEEYYLPSATLDLTINTDHTWDEGKVTKEPTCVDKGEMTFTCPVCQATKVEPIPETGIHSWDEGTVTKEPTGSKDGEMTYTCTVCRQTKTEVIPATGEHTWDEGVVTLAPTCTKEGVKLYTCTDCGATRQETLPATGAHRWDDGVVIRESSVVAEGSKRFTCQDCGLERTEVIARQAPCTGNVSCPGHGFSDWVSAEHWAHNAMDYAVTTGLMNGMGNGKYEPETELTRGMLVTILWRYAGSEDVGLSTFKDVPSEAYYAKSIAWAAKYGIVNGMGNNEFCPNDKITREQIAVILYRYADNEGVDVSKQGDFSTFEDGNEVSEYAQTAVKWATANGVLSGSKDYGKLYLHPRNNTRRCEAAKILMNYIELILK